MATIGDREYTSFRNVNLRGRSNTAAQDTGELRIEGNGFAGTATVNVSYFDKNVAWTLPAKSGGIPITGTFSVDFPAIAATTYTFSTAVTVSGLRVEDAITVTPNATFASSATARILIGAVPTADTVTLYFANIGSAANGLYAQTFSYTAYR